MRRNPNLLAHFEKYAEQFLEQLAKRCLQENYTVEDIPCMVGFSDPMDRNDAPGI